MNPGATPTVVGALLDLDAPEDRIRNPNYLGPSSTAPSQKISRRNREKNGICAITSKVENIDIIKTPTLLKTCKNY